MRKKDIADTPRVPEPYLISMSRGGRFVLSSEKISTGRRRLLLKLRAASENGAHREALIYLKNNP